MSKKTKRKFSEQFKLNVVLESFASGNISETAARHNLHVSVLNKWRKQIQKEGPKIFRFRKKYGADKQREIEQLKKIIGDLSVENHILKKTQELLS